MEALFIRVCNMGFTAVWLILAVILFRLIFKKAPKFIVCILWGLVAVRLVVPFSFESIFSLIPNPEPISPEIIYETTPAIDSGVAVVDDSVNSILKEHFTTDVAASANPLQILTFTFAFVWLIGILAMLLYGVISFIVFKYRVSVSIHLNGNIWICDNISTPFILGVICPRIYLPSNMNDKQIEYVIAHERAHLLRKDHWWKVIGFAVLSIHWFNPLVWVAYILLCRDIEYACDERVIKDMDAVSIKNYSNTLLECSISRRSPLQCPLAFGEVGVKQRIKSVLSFKKTTIWLIIVALIVGAAMCVLFMTDPKEDTQYDLWVIEGENLGIKNIAYVQNRNVCYYKVDEVKVIINGTYLDLYDALQQDENVLTKIIDKAKKNGKVEKDTDSGSALYRLDEYSVLELKTTVSVIYEDMIPLSQQIPQTYDFGVYIGPSDMQYEEINKLWTNRNVSFDKESATTLDIAGKSSVLYGGEDSNGNIASEVITQYYDYFSAGNRLKMKELYSDVLLQRNAVWQEMELLELKHCNVVDAALLRSSDIELLNNLSEDYYAYCYVQTSDEIKCTEDGASGSKGEIVKRNYIYLLVRETYNSPWKIYDYGYPPIYVPSE